MKRRIPYLIILFMTFVVSMIAVPETMSAQGQAAISISPTNITRPQSVTITVVPPSGLDLSHISAKQVAIEPADGIANLQAIPQPGVNELRVDFTIDASAQLGPRTLIIFDDNRLVLSSAVFTVLNDLNCPNQQECCSTDSHTGLCVECRSSCPHPVGHCPAGKHCCDTDQTGGRCNDCEPIGHQCM